MAFEAADLTRLGRHRDRGRDRPGRWPRASWPSPGARVLLVEKKRFPRWKICGACLNGQALACLRIGRPGIAGRLGWERIGLDEFQVGFRGRTARVAMPEGVIAFPLAARRRPGRGRDRCRGAVPCRNAGRVGRTFATALRLVRLDTRGGRSRSRLASCWSPPVWGIAFGRRHSAARREFRPGSRIGAGCLIANAPGFYDERTIFMAVGTRGLCRRGAGRGREPERRRRVRAGTAFGHWGAPGLAAAAILAEAGFPPIAGLEDCTLAGDGRPHAADSAAGRGSAVSAG